MQNNFFQAALALIFLISCGGGGGGGDAAPVNQNSTPTISGNISEIRVGESLNFIPTANDPDGDILTFSITGMPAWATFDSSSGLLNGIPLAEDLGSVSAITITVSDGEFNASIGPFNLTVTEPIFFY